MATVADRVARVEHTLLCVNIDQKAKRRDPPEPIRRPGIKPARTKAKLTENSANRLFELLNGGAA